jgi:hypothetical protein
MCQRVRLFNHTYSSQQSKTLDRAIVGRMHYVAIRCAVITWADWREFPALLAVAVEAGHTKLRLE